jgi:cell division protein FtsN
MSEQSRKVLALALGVSFFALIVVLAAFFLFSPGKGDGSEPFSIGEKAEPRQDTPSDFLVNAPQDNLSTQTTSAGDIIIVYGNEPSASEAAKPASSSPTTIVVGPSAKSESPAPEVAAPAAATSAPAVKAPAVKAPVATTTTVNPQSTSAQPKPSATTTAKPAAPAPAAGAAAAKSAPASGDYWIQAGSFSVKSNAEALKALFEEKKLPVSILVKEVDGKSRYTVKVGPYPSRAEASKWLSAAKSVKGAEQSWITQ